MTDQSPVREQLLNAIDATFCQSLGFGTPEGLLAAYEASRTQTVDRDALRETVAGVLAAHDWLYFSRGRRYAVADAILAAVLPATTNHDTDTSAEHRCADCGGGFAPGSDVELTHNCDDHRTVDEAPAATCSAQYHGPGEDRARLCIRAAQHQRTAHTDEHGFHWSDTVAMYPVADGTFRIGTDVRAELRRVADETAATGAQAASTAPLAAGLPLVKGRCPACGTAGLFLGNGGYVTCSLIDCPEPDAASTVLEQPTVGARQDKTVAAPCVECDHPQTDHEEGEDPVTPGHCRTCPDDDARHDYQAATVRQDGAQS